MVWKSMLVVFATVLMLVAATAFWTEMLDRNAGYSINLRDFYILAVLSRWYQGTVLVIVGIAGWLLRRWPR
jgi:hypothetical protein